MIATHPATALRNPLWLGLSAVAVAALTACSVSTPAPGGAVTDGAVPAETGSAAQEAAETWSATADAADSPAAGTATPAAGLLSVEEACAGFNTLFATYAANKGTDANAYEDVYLAADELGSQVSGDLKGLFASLAVLALDHATATENGGFPSKESRSAVSDAVLANAATCSAEGVPLRL